MEHMVHMPLNLDTFGFVTREQRNGRTVKNRCGRDFLYYALHYYLPEKFNPRACNPVAMETQSVLGFPVPAWLVWTCLPFYNVPALLALHGLLLEINGRKIISYRSFLQAMVHPKRMSAEGLITSVESAVKNGMVVGIDLAIALGGLVDHVMFVYGYDDEHFYVFDTHHIPVLEYEKITDDNRFIMRITKRAVAKRLTRWKRLWIIKKT